MPNCKPCVNAAAIALFLLFLFAATSCQVVAPLALTSTSMGVAYYYLNVSEKTCVYDIDTMKKASVVTLRRMGFSVGEQKDGDGVRKIEANADDLRITVKLRKVTDRCTRIKVTAKKDVVLRDRATASEIILQTERAAELMKIGRR